MQDNKLLVFLGNPGAQYVKNRHNAGRLFADALGFDINWQKKFKSLFFSVHPTAGICEGSVYLLEPETFMNLSGLAVSEAASFCKISAENILVIHDEVELPLGTAAFKFSGGMGGHNGLRSIKASLGTADFWRLRIGIGRPGAKGEQGIYDWVLSDFTKEESPVIEEMFSACAAPLKQALLSGFGALPTGKISLPKR